MVSIAPNSQSLNYTHMFDFVDYKPTPSEKYCEGSVGDILHQKGNFTKFLKVLDRSRLTYNFGHQYRGFTLFAAPDEHLNHIPDDFFNEMDIGLARQIILHSTLIRKLNKCLITSSPVTYFTTKYSRVYVTNINGITNIDNCSRILEYDVPVTGGTIHITDNLLMPTDDTYIN
jgi:hypothetical protein